MALRKIRIVSSGVGATTKVLDAETGQELQKLYPISAVEWHVDARGMATAKLTIKNVQVDVVGQWDEGGDANVPDDVATAPTPKEP